MSANSNNESDTNNNEGQVVVVGQSSALQVEAQGADLAIGSLQEQTESGGQCEETADTQQVDSDDDMDGDEQEDEGSSSDSGESFTLEGNARPQVLHTPDTRAAELADRMRGGVHQSHLPSWRLEGRQVSTSRARPDESKPVDNADEFPTLAATVGYHTTIRPCAEGEHQAAEALNLFGQRGRSMKDLRYCILRLCFRELSVVSGDMWERNMTFFHDWREFAAALRLAQCKEEAKRQDVAVPSWYLLDGRTGTQMARPFNPEEDRVGGDEGLLLSYKPEGFIWFFKLTT
jgi:hypothetical protein